MAVGYMTICLTPYPKKLKKDQQDAQWEWMSKECQRLSISLLPQAFE